jgi:hypothetical protein
MGQNHSLGDISLVVNALCNLVCIKDIGIDISDICLIHEDISTYANLIQIQVALLDKKIGETYNFRKEENPHCFFSPSFLYYYDSNKNRK